MSDRSVLLLAMAVAVGARLAWPTPWPFACLVLVAAAVVRHPALVALAGFVVAATLAGKAWQGLAPPPTTLVAGSAVVVRDPTDDHGPVRVELRLGRRHVEAWAHGAPGVALRSRLAGEQVWVRGRLRAAPESVRRRLATRHIAARLDVYEVGAWRAGSVASRAANASRRLLERGARPLRGDARTIALGVTIGDTRGQREELAQDFRASGLSHLLVVSGENLAFVLALFGPVLRRLSLRVRFAATLGVIGMFGLLTRWEPSVLRASALAALACAAFTVGRPSSRLRLLTLAVTAVVLLDPLLVHSLSFRLSVGATAGIAMFAAPMARRLPGPRSCAEALAVTIAAQIGVAPVALPAFGGLPLASVPANLLAVPAAAPLTAWGLVGGGLAGVLGPPFDGWLQTPTRALAGWLALVARWGADLPLGQVRTPHAVALAVIVGLVWAVRSRRWRSWPSVRTASTSRPGRS